MTLSRAALLYIGSHRKEIHGLLCSEGTDHEYPCSCDLRNIQEELLSWSSSGVDTADLRDGYGMALHRNEVHSEGHNAFNERFLACDTVSGPFPDPSSSSEVRNELLSQHDNIDGCHRRILPPSV